MACTLPRKDWATLLHFYYRYHYLLITNYLTIKLHVTYNSSACREYLAKNHLSFPSAPCWVRHSYLSKVLPLIPYTCGSSHDYYSGLIMWRHKNSRGKCWVVSQQALFFHAFLARHEDFYDAHIKGSN